MDGTSLYCGGKRVKLFGAATPAQIIAEHGKIITFGAAHCLACHVRAVRLQLEIGIICISTRSKRPALIRPGVTRFQMTADA